MESGFSLLGENFLASGIELYVTAVWLLEILTFFMVMLPEPAIVERNALMQIRTH